MTSAQNSPSASGADPTATRRQPWRPERWGLVLAVSTIAVIGWRNLPPGVCLDDPGDLQTAAATLGIAHPPGYIGYAAVGWVLCHVLPFVEPAYVVSLMCLACMTVALSLLAVLLTRAGLHVVLAAAMALALLSHRYVWQSLVLPEVYAPTLAGLLGSAFMLLRYAKTQRMRDLCIATGLFGFVVINRPPVVLMLPGFLVAWVVIERRFGTRLKTGLRRFLVGAVSGLVPVVACVTLLIVRDTPSAPYNYLIEYDDGREVLVKLDGSLHAKLERAAWILTSVQYRDKLGADFGQIRSKWRYIRRQLHVYEWPRFACAVLLLAAGTWYLGRKSPESALVAWGIIVGNLAFVLHYQVHGQAADTLPTVFASAWLGGAALARIVPHAGTRLRIVAWLRTAVAAPVFLIAVVWTIYHSETRYDYAAHRDATAYMTRIDFASLPRDSVVFADWQKSRPLWYARSVVFDRRDVRIVTTRGGFEAKLWDEVKDRPVFCTSERGAPDGWHFLRQGEFWRLVRHD
ncbi:MAG: DUF2723 domain-containing protein [Phycisphaerae bacterium]|jgi:hypothetical protein